MEAWGVRLYPRIQDRFQFQENAQKKKAPETDAPEASFESLSSF